MLSIKWCRFQWSWTTLTLFLRSHHSLALNISQTATDTAIITIEREREAARKLLNGTSFIDLEWPLSQISRSRYYSTLNNSQMVQDRAIVTIFWWNKAVCNGGLIESHTWCMVYRTAPFSMTLTDPKPRFQGQAIFWHWICPKWLQIRP